MGPSLTDATATLTRSDLEALAGITMLRLPLRSAEWHRLQHMRALLDAASELTQRFGAHTRCMLVNCGGRHCSGDLDAETDALFAAIERYTVLVREVVGEYSGLMSTSAPETDMTEMLLPSVVTASTGHLSARSA